MEDPSKVSFCIVLTFGLGTFQSKTEENLSPCKHRACAPSVCMRVHDCAKVRVPPHATEIRL